MTPLKALLGAQWDREVYLSTKEGAELTSKPTREAFIKWCRRQQPTIALRRPKGCRSLLVKKSDLDWALRLR